MLSRALTAVALVMSVAVIVIGGAGPAAATNYSVYCANGKIEVDSRDFKQMKSARGSGVCLLSQFNYLSDAKSFAVKNFGGEGKACSCK